ncbi:hypothetical protein [Evansella tamaricis]|uniref:Uncharacterized protein n=1 Tax=Evansella tamaricis TaxID=2069301 RepID=A0ABS6JBK7_9BACI|nr:hypothetical protein [Evansella tamaricis]MBU9710227.1 hypothetical protein [Evansella tamaricis]
MKNKLLTTFLSVMMPGVGQLHNRQFIKGIIILVLEHVVNKLGNINMAILLCLNGRTEEALDIVSYDFALFYPGFYVFTVYDAILHARKETNINGGYFYGLAGFAGCFGVIYSEYIPNPLFTVGMTMIICMFIGTYLFTKKQSGTS